ncbi:alkaline serine protease AorO [Drechmeria coniospora]|uniref:Alkaline serine protease AorO n=1 Tax=Drechmeria coniospora TaxID=98403 RepID=A0A151GTX8_DRECN|nr:alkaline serine protease AorO [Drechmeria coniospora]KYK60569.1 alkaline serine protease AorO [Drechmeria coniospora]ODA80724.1 hypothetical protein RJ55_03683 [Drechmeria coniospora]
MKGSLILFSSLLTGAMAMAVPGYVVHEKRGNHPRWVKGKPLDGHTKIPVRIALKQRNLDKGMDYLLEVSDPESPKYGQHYTADEVVELFAPDEQSVQTVKDWLTSAGIPGGTIRVPKSKAWVHFDATVDQLEDVLGTRYHVYNHVESRNEHVGVDSYRLPREVAEHVEFVTPGVVFAPRTRAVGKQMKREEKLPRAKVRPMPVELAQKLRSNPERTDDCGRAITPACIKAMYNITDGKLASAGNQLGIFELDEQKYSQEDLDQFYGAYASHVPSGTGPKVDGIDGGTAPGSQDSAGAEADLDFQIGIPIVHPQGTILFQTVAQNNDIFNTFLDAVDGSYCTKSAYGETGDDPDVDGITPDEQCGAFEPAHVISFSYGSAEADYPTYYLQRQCDEFMKLGLQGTTLVMSSGDDGVARRSGPCLGPNEDIFAPDTAANCPYITAVGSTTLPAGSKAGDDEVATTSFSSGGGFSNIFTTPAYQRKAVSSYFDEHDPGYKHYNTSDGKIPDGGGIYNRAGRGYPDLAAVGDNGAFIIGGSHQLAGGTSMSGPLVAAMFTRINDERIAAGKGPIGFANPTLYQHPEMFHDITTGNQDKGGPDGDGGASACGNSGFSAVPGWDPVTGLGTPNYAAFLDVFMSI